VALQLAQLGQKSVSGLDGETFSSNYTRTVTVFGQAAASVTSQISDQDVVTKMLQQQRDSVSGVSLDEEMTDIIKYQKAFEASAKIITTVDEMLSTIIGMKQ
jgi:flagellar hook-associated protein 1